VACSPQPLRGIRHTHMTSSLRTNQVRTVLNRLFAAATYDDETPCWRREGLSWESATSQERADAFEASYMPISPQGGELLCLLVRAKRPKTVVEFGTSYGISTIHLAAAVADNGTGHVVSTELSAAKVCGRSRQFGRSQPRRSRHDSIRRCHDDFERYLGTNRPRTARCLERLVLASSAVARIPSGDRCVDCG
jgi:hypothetical protein